MAVLLVLIGTRGSGKSTTLDYLGRNGILVLKPSTTRPRRTADDKEYHFETNWEKVDLEWRIAVGEFQYGMRRSEIDRAVERGLGVTIFEPGEIGELHEFRERRRIEVITVGLDTLDSVQEQTRRTQGNALRVVSEDKFNFDREVVRECDVVFDGDERIVGEAVLATCRVVGARGGKIDGATIEAFLRGGSLLTDAEGANVQSASYDLRLGEQAWCQGRFVQLDKQNPTLKIPAYSYAIVTAHEEAMLPRFLTASYDLTVSGFMDGLVLSNGPQVDPGYRGSLFCTLFNGRDVARGVTLGRHFATIEFNTTTSVTQGYGGKYQGKKDLSAFVSENTAVSPGGNIVERIDNLEKSIDAKVAPVRQFFIGSLGVALLIHLSVAGWLWLGSPNLAAWITGCGGGSAQVESGQEKGVSRENRQREEEADKEDKLDVELGR